MIVVTGGSGFIGTAVMAELDRRGWKGSTFDHPDSILDMEALSEAIGGATAVINLAGRLGTSETFGVERDTARVNIIGALNVADVCRTFDVPMVQIGTGHKGQPNPYAITKGCAEDLLLGRAQTGQAINVVRAYHAYGPGQKAFPPHGKSAVRKIIPSFVCRALSGMPVEVTGSGAQLIDLVHVDEVARILVDATEGPWGTVLEAGTGHPLSVLETAETVIKLTRSTSTIEHLPLRPGEPEDAHVVAEHPLSEKRFPYGMGETIAYYRNLIS